MRCLKMLGLAAAAALALTAFVGAGTASANKLCKTANCSEDLTVGDEISASLTGSTEFRSGLTTMTTCTGGAIAGKLKATSTTPINITVETLTLINCTKGTNTLKKGTLAFEYTSGDNGALLLTGTEITISSIFGSCVYGPNGIITLGLLNGGENAKIEVNAGLSRTGGGMGCPETTVWTGTFNVTTPPSLYGSP